MDLKSIFSQQKQSRQITKKEKHYVALSEKLIQALVLQALTSDYGKKKASSLFLEVYPELAEKKTDTALKQYIYRLRELGKEINQILSGNGLRIAIGEVGS